MSIATGTTTTSGDISNPVSTITLDGFAGRPKISLTPVGENAGDVTVWVNSIIHTENEAWQAEIESSVPSVLIHYKVIGSTRI